MQPVHAHTSDHYKALFKLVVKGTNPLPGSSRSTDYSARVVSATDLRISHAR